ncbi:MAG: DUF2092 domain-containing protein [Cyclobacteriaceae bacterium]|nr:DUF2092 domain-containing protein [Cyclobacteriaceae bacterium]
MALLTMCWSCDKQSEKLYDAAAIEQLDMLTETIGALTSCSFILTTTNVKDGNAEAQHTSTNDIYLRGPDKMYIYTHNAPIRKAYYYNGTRLAVLRFDEKTYDEIDAPDNIIKTIDEVHNVYGVDFPAADFFYPTLTDDMMADFDTIAMVQNTIVDGVGCQQIYATNAEHAVFIAIDPKQHLPMLLEIFGKGDKAGEVYSGVFSGWKLNPKLPDTMFNFTAPEGTTKAALLTKPIN